MQRDSAVREEMRQDRRFYPEANGPPLLPMHRGGCEPCKHCEAWRPEYVARLAAGEKEAPDRVLLCGHDLAESIAHSRPCVFVSCRHNLYCDIHPTKGSLKINQPNLAPDEVGESCALDIADDGKATLYRVGNALNITREGTRQVENKALRRLRTYQQIELADFVETHGDEDDDEDTEGDVDE